MAIELIGNKLNAENGTDAARFELAARYIDAFGELAQEGNTLILPADVSNVPNMVATAMKTFSTIEKAQLPK